jgi:hypothetical protein
MVLILQVHLIELQERKRQLLKARAEYHASDKNDVLNAWDDEDERKEIPDEVQVQTSDVHIFVTV